MTEQVIVRMGDLRTLRYCARGVREFFGRYGLDYGDFLQNGVPADKLLKASDNDAMAEAAVEVARGRKQ